MATQVEPYGGGICYPPFKAEGREYGWGLRIVSSSITFNQINNEQQFSEGDYSP